MGLEKEYKAILAEARAVPIIMERSRVASLSPEQAAAAMCREHLERMPEAYAEIQNMRFVG